MQRLISVLVLGGVLALGIGAAYVVKPEWFMAGDSEGMEPPREIADGKALESLLSGAPFVHPGDTDGPVLYVIGFRSCPPCLAFKEAEYARLLADGADVRWLTYARKDRPDGTVRSKPGERAMVAEIARTRDYALWQRWYAVSPETFYEAEPLPPSADGDATREALLNAERARVDALADLMAAQGWDLFIPAMFWRDRTSGKWMVYVGYEAEGFAAVRASLFGTRPAG